MAYSGTSNQAAGTANSTRAFGSVTVATGDVVAVAWVCEELFAGLTCTLAKTAGTATLGTITKNLASTTASHTAQAAWTFTVTGGGTMTLTFTITITGTFSTMHSGASMLVATGSAGVGNTAKAETTQTVALTVSANSAVLMARGDWSAAASNAVTFTPAGSTEDEASSDGTNHKTTAGVSYSVGVAHWADTGAGGALTYGTSAPTGGTYGTVAVEMLGAAGAAFLPAETYVVNQAITRSNYY
jgi:hypothetical protein